MTQNEQNQKGYKGNLPQNNCHKLNITIDDLLGECDLHLKMLS